MENRPSVMALAPLALCPRYDRPPCNDVSVCAVSFLLTLPACCSLLQAVASLTGTVTVHPLFQPSRCASLSPSPPEVHVLHCTAPRACCVHSFALPRSPYLDDWWVPARVSVGPCDISTWRGRVRHSTRWRPWVGLSGASWCHRYAPGAASAPICCCRGCELRHMLSRGAV